MSTTLEEVRPREFEVKLDGKTVGSIVKKDRVASWVVRESTPLAEFKEDYDLIVSGDLAFISDFELDSGSYSESLAAEALKHFECGQIDKGQSVVALLALASSIDFFKNQEYTPVGYVESAGRYIMFKQVIPVNEEVG